MNKAIYYNENLVPKTFDVITKNDDGTVDIGTGKTVVVAKANVTEKPTIGCVTILTPTEAAKVEKETEVAAEKAAKADKAAVEETVPRARK